MQNCSYKKGSFGQKNELLKMLWKVLLNQLQISDLGRTRKLIYSWHCRVISIHLSQLKSRKWKQLCLLFMKIQLHKTKSIISLLILVLVSISVVAFQFFCVIFLKTVALESQTTSYSKIRETTKVWEHNKLNRNWTGIFMTMLFGERCCA